MLRDRLALRESLPGAINCPVALLAVTGATPPALMRSTEFNFWFRACLPMALSNDISTFLGRELDRDSSFGALPG